MLDTKEKRATTRSKLTILKCTVEGDKRTRLNRSKKNVYDLNLSKLVFDRSVRIGGCHRARQ